MNPAKKPQKIHKNQKKTTKTHKKLRKKENETSQTVKHPLMGRPIVRPMYIGN
jgi:hypothetical protein